MPTETRASEKGNDDNVKKGGGIEGDNEKGNKNAIKKVDDVIYVEIFQWENFDKGKESDEEEYQAYEIVNLVPEAVVESDGLRSVVQLSGSEEIYQDTNNNDHVGKVAIVERYMSLDGAVIDDPDQDEFCLVDVRMIPIEGEL